MTLDHFAVIVIQNGKLYGFSPEYYQMAVETAEGARWLELYHVFRFLGRLSFPVFAFLVVEGFIHTQSFWKYFGRMLLMALVSEVPYDLGFYNEILDLRAQNVGFTFLLALLMLLCMKRFRRRPWMKWGSVIAFAAAAEFLRVDYGALAIIMMALLYDFRKEKLLRMSSLTVVSALNSLECFGFGAFAVIPLLFYNGERGSSGFKWLFYVYYPLHLMVFYIMIYVGSLITA